MGLFQGPLGVTPKNPLATDISVAYKHSVGGLSGPNVNFEASKKNNPFFRL